MPERIELELRALGHELDLPVAPALSAVVAARLRSEPARRPFRRRRLVIALAALIVAVAAALAVEPVRAALWDVLGIGGVQVERVDTLPPVRPPGELGLGVEVPLDQARRAADFPAQVADPAVWGDPDAVFFSESIPGGAVSLLYGSEESVRMLLSEFRGRVEPGLVKKLASSRTRIEFVDVRGTTGFWITGEPHAVAFFDREETQREDVFRLAANTLIWVESGVTYRLEGDFDLGTARLIANSLR